MISVIIPTYNRKELLPRAVDSIFVQTVQDFEIIIADDGSTDGTEAMVREKYHDPRIRYERLEKNSGVHAARNRGLDLAKGEYIVLLDSDDELLPHAFSTALDASEKNVEIDFVSAAFQTQDGALTGWDRLDSCYIPYEEVLCERGHRQYKNSFAMMRHSAIGGSRYVAPNVDFIFFRHVAKAARKIFFINEPLGIYHISNDPSSLHITRRVPNIERSIMRAQALETFVCDFENDFCKYCPKNLGPYAYGAAVGLLLDGKQWRAVQQAYKAARFSFRANYLLFFLFTLLPLSTALLRLLFRLKQRGTK